MNPMKKSAGQVVAAGLGTDSGHVPHGGKKGEPLVVSPTKWLVMGSGGNVEGSGERGEGG